MDNVQAFLSLSLVLSLTHRCGVKFAQERGEMVYLAPRKNIFIVVELGLKCFHRLVCALLLLSMMIMMMMMLMLAMGKEEKNASKDGPDVKVCQKRFVKADDGICVRTSSTNMKC